jgi:hypothetical protein
MSTLGMMFLVIVLSAFINALVFKKVLGKD